MGDKQFWRSFGISVLRVVLGLSVNITLLVLTAYPLSKSPKFFTGQKVYMSLILFAMLFSGGLIPTFMVVNSLKLTNIAGSRAAGECDSADERLPGSAQIIGGGRHD